jgi:phasin
MARKPQFAAQTPALVVADPAPHFVVSEPPMTESAPVALATAFEAPEPAPTALEAVPSTLAEAVTAPMQEAVKTLSVATAPLPQVRDTMREALEKSLADTRAKYVKAKTAAEETASALEASYATAKTGVAEINAKAIEALRASADANFDFMKSVFGVKTMSDYVTLHTEFARKQVEMLTGQTKEFSALAKKVADQSVEPIKAQVAKTLKIAV